MIYEKLDKITKELINNYISLKEKVIMNLLQDFSLDIDWTNNIKPEMIRDYVLEVFLQMIIIDNEIMETIGDIKSEKYILIIYIDLQKIYHFLILFFQHYQNCYLIFMKKKYQKLKNLVQKVMLLLNQKFNLVEKYIKNI